MTLHPDQEAVVRWVTGEMIGSEARALEQHVAECEACSGRLSGEAALDVVMHAAGELADLDDDSGLDWDAQPIPAPLAIAPRVGLARGWRQALAVAAAVVVVALAGRGLQDAPGLDRTEAPAHVASRAAPLDGPASWAPSDMLADMLADPICEPPDEGATDDETLCIEPVNLLAMAGVGAPTPWSIGRDPSPVREDGCTTPVDTGDSLTCDDWLSADDVSG